MIQITPTVTKIMGCGNSPGIFSKDPGQHESDTSVSVRITPLKTAKVKSNHNPLLGYD